MVRIEWKQPQEVIKRLVVRKFPSKIPLTPQQYRSVASKTTMAPKMKELRVVLNRMPKIKLTPKKKASGAKPLKKRKGRVEKAGDVRSLVEEM